jgi:hypothetical protein
MDTVINTRCDLHLNNPVLHPSAEGNSSNFLERKATQALCDAGKVESKKVCGAKLIIIMIMSANSKKRKNKSAQMGCVWGAQLLMKTFRLGQKLPGGVFIVLKCKTDSVASATNILCGL